MKSQQLENLKIALCDKVKTSFRQKYMESIDDKYLNMKIKENVEKYSEKDGFIE